MTKPIDYMAIRPFTHKSNITIGAGRVLWVAGDGLGVAPGYALPGGTRTQDKAHAEQVARWIDTRSRKP